jgi:hypothetical protein
VKHTRLHRHIDHLDRQNRTTNREEHQHKYLSGANKNANYVNNDLLKISQFIHKQEIIYDRANSY